MSANARSWTWNGAKAMLALMAGLLVTISWLAIDAMTTDTEETGPTVRSRERILFVSRDWAFTNVLSGDLEVALASAFDADSIGGAKKMHGVLGRPWGVFTRGQHSLPWNGIYVRSENYTRGSQRVIEVPELETLSSRYLQFMKDSAREPSLNDWKVIFDGNSTQSHK